MDRSRLSRSTASIDASCRRRLEGITQAGVDWEKGTGDHHKAKMAEGGVCLQDWLAEGEFSAACTYYASGGPTFFGPTGCTSCIDSFVVLADMLPTVVRYNVAWSLGRRLQLIPSKHVRDHLPVAMDFRYTFRFDALLASPSGSDTAQAWDYNLLAACLQTGHRRIVFLEALSARMREIQPALERVRAEDAADNHWDFMVRALREIGGKFFGKSKKSRTEKQESDAIRRRVLCKWLAEARLRHGVGTLVGNDELGSGDPAEWKMELYKLQREARSEMRRQRAQHRALLLNELAEAKAAGHTADVHRLSRCLAGTKVGVKKRIVGRLPSARPSTEDVKLSAVSPAKSGGLSGVVVDFEEETAKMKAGYGPLVERDANVEKMARDDFKRTVWRLKKASKRRASPDWSCPTELWLLAMAPHYCSVRAPSVEALGAKTVADIKGDGFTEFSGEMFEIFVHVRRARATPMVANLSRAFFIAKPNGLAGLKGQRLLHIMCPLWRSFYGGLVHKGLKETGFTWLHSAHAYLKGRRVEGALLSRNCVAWILRFLGKAFYADLRDMTNAFACTTPERRKETLEEMIAIEDQHLFDQRASQACVRFECGDEAPFFVVPQTGNLIGSAEGVALCADDVVPKTSR